MYETPDLQLAGLSIWVLGRQFPDANDYWDGNWLNVKVRVEAPGASVRVRGPVIHARELASFLAELELLDRTLTGEASLTCMEPNLAIKLTTATVTITVTPDHLTQSHRFAFSIDQTNLKPLIVACRQILEVYPIKGSRAAPTA